MENNNGGNNPNDLKFMFPNQHGKWNETFDSVSNFAYDIFNATQMCA